MLRYTGLYRRIGLILAYTLVTLRNYILMMGALFE